MVESFLKHKGKGENARYEQFSHFQCFQKNSVADMEKPGLVWERVKMKMVESSLNLRKEYRDWRICSLRAIFPFPLFSKDICCRHGKTRACLGKGYIFTTQSRLLIILGKKPFENMWKNEKMLVDQRFLFFPQCFQPFAKQILEFQSHSFCRLQMLSI